MGVVDGVDMQLSGEVRRIDTEAIQQRLDDGDIVLISPIGYSPTGEIFNLTVEEVATQVAGADERRQADLPDGHRRRAQRPAPAAVGPLDARRRGAARASPSGLASDVRVYLPAAIRACDNGVKRAHPHQPPSRTARCCSSSSRATAWHDDRVDRRSRTSATRRSTTWAASSRSSSPLEEQGVLVRRSRERLEAEIERFVVAEYDNHIIGCAALYAFPEERVGELAAACRASGLPAPKATAKALMHDRAARAQAQAREPVRADDEDVALVSRAWLPQRDDRRASAAESRHSTITSASRWSTARRYSLPPGRPKGGLLPLRGQRTK
jgi:amino-acid N-acetyltransferase